MTKDRAIELLRNYERNWTCKPSYRLAKKCMSYRNNGYIYDICEDFVINELITGIQNSTKGAEPIEVVRDFYYLMDDSVCASSSPKVWGPASMMESIAGDILRYLRRSTNE